MNSEEAAASLFGSEDSGSDLFAALGTEDASLPEDGLFPVETSSQRDVYNFLSDTPSHSDNTTSSSTGFPSQTHTNIVAPVFDSSVRHEWSKPENANGLHDEPYGRATDSQNQRTNHDIYTLPTSAHPTAPTNFASYSSGLQYATSVAAQSSYQTSEPPAQIPSYTPAILNTYQPPPGGNSAYIPYTPPRANQIYSHIEPSNTNGQSTYPTYDSLNRPNYGAYDPPSVKAPTSQSQSSSYNAHTYVPSTQPYTPPYDGGETRPIEFASGQYSSYVSSSASVAPPVTQPTVHPLKTSVLRPKVSNAYDPPFPVTLSIRKNNRTSLLSTYAQYQQPTDSSRKLPADGRSADVIFPESYDSPDSRGRSAEANPALYDDKHDYNNYVSRTREDTHSRHYTRVDNMLSNNYTNNNVEVHAATSPASTPLPHSPVGNGASESLEKRTMSSHYVDVVGSSQSSYTHEQVIKKGGSIMADLYAPQISHTSGNYIPRTASPLSLHNGRPNEPSKRVPGTALYPTSVGTYPFVPKQLSGSVSSTVSHSLSNVSQHNSTASHAVQWPESKPQELVVKPMIGQYAPSPSLIAANDPLSRTSARAPVVTFGFGGKIITCFHGMPGLNAGFDVAFSSRTTSELKIRVLHKVLPEISSSNTETYPGPLLADPGSASISLVRNQAAQMKSKKASVLSYLAGRISEIHQGLGYLSSSERRLAEDRLILVQLLKIMVENDGRLLGTQQTEMAIRSFLVPRLDGASVLQDAVSIQESMTGAVSDETPISVTTLKPSALDRIEQFLLRGDRRQAYQYAAEQNLWAHAMVIASSIDKESWKEVVHDFLRTELAVKDEIDNTSLSVNKVTGAQLHQSNRESLRVAYSLFSGQGPAAIQEVAPLTLLQRGLGRFQSPLVSSVTPRTPNFSAMQMVATLPTVPAAALATWAKTTAMIISSPLTPEASAALTALGDQLLANNFVEAAHVCYLLSPQTSLIGGLGSAAAKITLVGTRNGTNVMKDVDALIFSEIFEFALSLAPVIKGQEPFHGVPQLQAYRFVRSVMLAEVGEVQVANRYCDAITTCLTHFSPHTTLALLEQLQGLQQRISGVSPGDKGTSWIGGKIGKPSLDSIGGWLEGRFTKLVTGESETDDADGVMPKKAADQPFVGPFASYSNISTTPSARSSPAPQVSVTSNTPAQPQRTSSAMATSSPYSQPVHVERSSSATEYGRQMPSVGTYTPISNSAPSSQSSPISNTSGQMHGFDPYTPQHRGTSNSNDELETPVQSSWWGSTQAESESNTTPTVATFMKVDGASVQTDDGFISLMDDNAFSLGPSNLTYLSSKTSISKDLVEEDEDDLGLGNSKPKPKHSVESEDPVKAEATAPQSKVEPPAATSAPSSGSWLGRWWKRSDSSTPGPIKASLGEESAFYYDKELKRWVNRKAGGAEAEKPATPPPPPSRAQTASPGMTGGKTVSSTGGAPPARSASAVDLGEPPKAPMRIRSNLAPLTESAPSTPTGSRTIPPGAPPGAAPPARPKSQATKRNIRSRYVDVLQGEGGTA